MATPTTPRGYQLPATTNMLSQDVLRIIAGITAIDGDISNLFNLIAALGDSYLKLVGAQTVAGVKTFSASPLVPDLAASDNSQNAVNSKFVKTAIANLVASSPAALDTLNELAAALGNDPNFATTITTMLAAKANTTDVNTALAAKADLSAMTTALAGKAVVSHTHTASQVSGGPAFSAYLGSTQTVSNGVATKIALNTETFDPDSAFDSTTNYRFQPAVAGYYYFTGKLAGAASTAATSCVALIYKNGSAVKQGPSYVAASGQGMTAGVAGLVYLNGTTDYVELWGVNSGTGTNTFTAGATSCFFDGYFVRP